MLGFSRFGHEFNLFLAEQVHSSGLLGEFERVRSSVLVGASQTWVQMSLKFDLSSSKLFEVCYIWVRYHEKMSPNFFSSQTLV